MDIDTDAKQGARFVIRLRRSRPDEPRFYICWFEDQVRDIEGQRKVIERRLAQSFFRPDIQFVVPIRDGNEEKKSDREASIWMVRDPVQILDQLAERQFDLILVDYNLGQTSGADLAAAIRAKFPYTDIIFYSAKSRRELRTLMFEHDIDGVYCCSRTDLGSETASVVAAMTKRSFDMTTMRGIIVSAAGDHDHRWTVPVTLLSVLPAEIRAKALAQVVADVESFGAQNAKQLREHLTADSRDKLLSHRAFSSNMKYRVLKDHIGAVKIPAHKEAIVGVFREYEEELIKPRNVLAHASSEKEGRRVCSRVRG